MKRTSSYLALASLPLALTACELAPKETTQTGYRGTGGNQIYVADKGEMAEVPAPPYELVVSDGSPLASESYENVQVLGNISTDEFNYLMAAITEWVSPEEGCNYCHNPANMASDEVYTKGVARRMIQMTQNVNANWDQHVAQTGVTCWTCHRGNAVPEQVWTLPEGMEGMSTIAGNKHGQNNPIAATGYSSLPEASVARYLIGGDDMPEEIRVASTQSRTDDPGITTMETEQTYALMFHLSSSLGVNCTYCHNTQSFGDWSISPQTRATAWHGIRMVRDINGEYITPLTSVFPDNRLGVMGDPYKVNCTTCHQGQNKPMGGMSMIGDYPALQMLQTAVVPAMDDEDAPAAEMEEAQVTAILSPVAPS